MLAQKGVCSYCKYVRGMRKQRRSQQRAREVPERDVGKCSMRRGRGEAPGVCRGGSRQARAWAPGCGSRRGPVVFGEMGLYVLSPLIHRIASKKYLAVIISVSSQRKRSWQGLEQAQRLRPRANRVFSASFFTSLSFIISHTHPTKLPSQGLLQR